MRVNWLLLWLLLLLFAVALDQVESPESRVEITRIARITRKNRQNRLNPALSRPNRRSKSSESPTSPPSPPPPPPLSPVFNAKLLRDIRDKFHHIDDCPYQGRRIFFENAGGSLTLKSVVETTARLAAIPDNQGRDNPASQAMMRLIDAGRADMMCFLGAGPPESPESNKSTESDHSNNPPGPAQYGRVFIGESGTECLFRVIRACLLAAADGGQVIGSTLEHPATASAARQWAARTGRKYIAVAHHRATAAVQAQDYQQHLTADTRLASIIHTSPVTGTAVDVAAIAAAIRQTAPECFIVVDGIQHAPHGAVDVAVAPIDAYAVSGYKVFSRHNYGFAWLSPRLAALPHDALDGAAQAHWELGTRDAAAYATFTDVVDYLAWLGRHFTPSVHRRARLEAAAAAIAAQEKYLVDAMLHGADGQTGLAAMAPVSIIGGADNPNREGLISVAVATRPAAEVVAALDKRGVRVHIRNNDYFSANILTPLNLPAAVRVSMCHYNSVDEVKHFLAAMEAIIAE